MAALKRDRTPQNPTGQRRPAPAAPKAMRVGTVLAAMGPGLIAALSGTDAGGIATYSNAGALFGFGQLWTVPIMGFLMIVVQETAARMGCVTGKGFASLIREQFGVRMSAFAMLALLVSNTMVTLSEFAGIASGSYKRIEKVLLAICCVFITYVIAGFMVGPDWGDALNATLVPRLQATPEYLSLLVANIGTTIAPWMIFLAQSNVVDKNVGAAEIPFQRIDTATGAILASAISWFIIMATGVTLHPAGIAVDDAAQAAQALVPIAGAYAERLFGLGLVGASVLAASVLPGITSSAVCEAFGWEHGADRTWGEAPAYRGIITAIIALSAGVVLVPNVDLFGIMMAAQVVNGVLLPVLMVYMVRIASDRRIMGRYVNGRVWTAITWATIGVIAALTVVMFVLQALGY